jgi:hypothetical protein
MQQNLRVAMEVLSRDLSSAGYGTSFDGGTWGVGGRNGNDDVPIYGLRILEDFPATGLDAVEILYMDPAKSGAAITENSPPVSCGTTTITFMDPMYTALADNYSGTAPDDKLMCYTPSRKGNPTSYLWQVSGVSAPVITVNSNSGLNDYDGGCDPTWNVPKDLFCGAPRYVAYYIDNTADSVGFGTPETPVLYYVPDVFMADSLNGGYPSSSDIPIALGIENMQFSVCTQITGMDCSSAANWGSQFDPITAPGVEWEDLTSVRVSMTARSLRQDLNNGEVSAAQDLDPNDFQSVAAGADAYHRRIGSTEVAMRNAIGSFEIRKQGW